MCSGASICHFLRMDLHVKYFIPVMCLYSVKERNWQYEQLAAFLINQSRLQEIECGSVGSLRNSEAICSTPR